MVRGSRRARLVLFVSLIVIFLAAAARKRWEYGRLGSCSFMFSRSRRESYRNAQVDPLLLWMGSTARAIRSEEKHGAVPLPSSWGSFANILYAQCTSSTAESMTAMFTDFIVEWLHSKPEMQHRLVILAGEEQMNLASPTADASLIHLAAELVRKQQQDSLPLSMMSVFTSAPQFLPHAVFFASKSFESWNGMNFWTMDRASQPIVCNVQLPAVEFVHNDVSLTYSLMTSSENGDKSETYFYNLTSISTWEHCHDDIDIFATEFNARTTKLDKEYIDPVLPFRTSVLYPQCSVSTTKRSEENEVLERDIVYLLNSNVSILLYQDIAHGSSIICSFYIGIKTADALQYRKPVFELSHSIPLRSALHRFNRASLDTAPELWSIDSTAIGLIQQDTEHVHDDAKIGVLLLKSQQQRHGSANKNAMIVSKAGAAAIFAHLMQSLDDRNDVDFVDLIAMDAIDLALKENEIQSSQEPE